MEVVRREVLRREVLRREVLRIELEEGGNRGGEGKTLGKRETF